MGMRGSMMTCKVLLGDSLGAPRVYYRMDPVGPLTEVGRKCQLCIISSCFTYLFRLHISVDLTYLGLDVARLMSCSCLQSLDHLDGGFQASCSNCARLLGACSYPLLFVLLFLFLFILFVS